MTSPASGGAPLRVLFLAYYFPPLGGAGVQRSVHFVRHLPEHGIAPVVVTGPAPDDQVWPPRDDTLAALLPPDLEVHRVDGPLEPKPRTRAEAALQRWLLQPGDFARRWIAGSLEKGLEAARGEPVDVVVASMSPFESAASAAALADVLGVPWVADLRDPWALDEIMVYPSRWHRAVAVSRMARAVRSAAAVVANTPEAARAFRAELPGIDPARIVTIPNGFEPRDFPAPAPSASAAPPRPRGADAGARFRVVHTGHLHTLLGTHQRRQQRLRRWIGGMRVPIDLLTRSHVVLAEAVARWLEREPERRREIELVFVGPAGEAERRVVRDAGIEDCVRFLGYLDHDRSVESLLGADLLFLPMHALPHGERARIVPGKTYEYLAARRPILGAVPEGDARDFLAASGLGQLCAPGDAEAMARILTERHAAWRAGEPAPAANEAFIRRFERANLARGLAETLRAVVADAPLEPDPILG